MKRAKFLTALKARAVEAGSRPRLLRSAIQDAEIVAIGGGEGGEGRRLAAILLEEAQQVLQVARISVDGMHGAAPLMRASQFSHCSIAEARSGRAAKRRSRAVVFFYGFGRSSHVRMPNSITRPRKLISSVPWPAWK